MMMVIVMVAVVVVVAIVRDGRDGCLEEVVVVGHLRQLHCEFVLIHLARFFLMLLMWCTCTHCPFNPSCFSGNYFAAVLVVVVFGARARCLCWPNGSCLATGARLGCWSWT